MNGRHIFKQLPCAVLIAGLSALLLTVAMPIRALAQGTADPTGTSTPDGEDAHHHHKKDGQELLGPALQFLYDAKKHEKHKKQQPDDGAASEVSSPAAEPQPVEPAEAEVQQPAAQPAKHKTQTVHAIVPKPKQVPATSTAAVPAVITAPAINSQPMPAKPVAVDVLPSPAPSPAPETSAQKPIAMFWPLVIGTMLLLLAGVAYRARRLFGFSSPLPSVKVKVDQGTVSAPLFDKTVSLPAISLMVSSPAFSTTTEYPGGGSAP